MTLKQPARVRTLHLRERLVVAAGTEAFVDSLFNRWVIFYPEIYFNGPLRMIYAKSNAPNGWGVSLSYSFETSTRLVLDIYITSPVDLVDLVSAGNISGEDDCGGTFGISFNPVIDSNGTYSVGRLLYSQRAPMLGGARRAEATSPPYPLFYEPLPYSSPGFPSHVGLSQLDFAANSVAIDYIEVDYGDGVTEQVSPDTPLQASSYFIGASIPITFQEAAPAISSLIPHNYEQDGQYTLKVTTYDTLGRWTQKTNLLTITGVSSFAICHDFTDAIWTAKPVASDAQLYRTRLGAAARETLPLITGCKPVSMFQNARGDIFVFGLKAGGDYKLWRSQKYGVAGSFSEMATAAFSSSTYTKPDAVNGFDGGVVAIAIESATNKLWVKISRDDGATWGAQTLIQTLTTSVQFRIRQKATGELVAATSDQGIVYKSLDTGKTWASA